MPTYVYKCPEHGVIELSKTMGEADRAEYCPACFLSGFLNVEMRRVYTAPRVQNLTASENTLRTWGRDLRVEHGVTDAEGLIRERRARDAALAREGAPPPKAATMTEEG